MTQAKNKISRTCYSFPNNFKRVKNNPNNYFSASSSHAFPPHTLQLRRRKKIQLTLPIFFPRGKWVCVWSRSRFSSKKSRVNCTTLKLRDGDINLHPSKKSRTRHFPANKIFLLKKYCLIAPSSDFAQAAAATDPQKVFLLVMTRWLPPPQTCLLLGSTNFSFPQKLIAKSLKIFFFAGMYCMKWRQEFTAQTPVTMRGGNLFFWSSTVRILSWQRRKWPADFDSQIS